MPIANPKSGTRQGLPAAFAVEVEIQAQNNGMNDLLNQVGNLFQEMYLENLELAQANLVLEENVALSALKLKDANTELEKACIHRKAYVEVEVLQKIAVRDSYDVRLREAWASYF